MRPLTDYPAGCIVLLLAGAAGNAFAAGPAGPANLAGDAIEYDEAGLLDDGRAAFRVPEGYRYEFRRVE